MLSCHDDPFARFVCDLCMTECDVHIYNGPNSFLQHLAFGKDCPWHKEEWDTQNIYFLAGVRLGLQKRAADSDIKKRNMFTLDFDIRKELEKGGPNKMTDNEIRLAAEMLLSELSAHPFYKTMRYAVLSGNGLHVHYFGPPCDVIKEQWVAGMKDIFEEVNAFTSIPCDTGCGNAGRIMRLPGSWNVKDPLQKKPVEFIVWMLDYSLPPMQFVQDRGVLALSRQEQRKAIAEKEFTETHPDGGSDVIALINKIPIEQVVQQLLGCTIGQVKKDGGMRFVDDKGAERGFFRHAHHNIIVHEGTSLFAPPSGIGYNCLGLAKAVLGLSTHDAVAWFCARSTPVREAKDREKEKWAADNAAKDVLLFEKSLSSLPSI